MVPFFDFVFSIALPPPPEKFFVDALDNGEEKLLYVMEGHV